MSTNHFTMAGLAALQLSCDAQRTSDEYWRLALSITSRDLGPAGATTAALATKPFVEQLVERVATYAAQMRVPWPEIGEALASEECTLPQLEAAANDFVDGVYFPLRHGQTGDYVVLPDLHPPESSTRALDEWVVHAHNDAKNPSQSAVPAPGTLTRFLSRLPRSETSESLANYASTMSEEELRHYGAEPAAVRRAVRQSRRSFSSASIAQRDAGKVPSLGALAHLEFIDGVANLSDDARALVPRERLSVHEARSVLKRVGRMQRLAHEVIERGVVVDRLLGSRWDDINAVVRAADVPAARCDRYPLLADHFRAQAALAIVAHASDGGCDVPERLNVRDYAMRVQRIDTWLHNSAVRPDGRAAPDWKPGAKPVSKALELSLGQQIAEMSARLELMKSRMDYRTPLPQGVKLSDATKASSKLSVAVVTARSVAELESTPGIGL